MYGLTRRMSKPEVPDVPIPTHVRSGRYKLKNLIGSGTFGVVYKAVDVVTLKEYAVKLEFQQSTQLKAESKIIAGINAFGMFPYFVWAGWERFYYIMVMELLGDNLEKLFNSCKRQFSLKTILMVGYQMISRLEEVHSAHFTHCDIKPENFVVGEGTSKDTLFLVDFGLAKRYKSPHLQEHITYRSDRKLTGTARYASIRAHNGIEQSRRDDLEAVFYVLLYFLDGALPWQGLKGSSLTEKFSKICEMKKRISIKEMCKHFPPEFGTGLLYCRNLNFEENPDYEYLKSLIRTMMKNENQEFDWKYDWCKEKEASA